MLLSGLKVLMFEQGPLNTCQRLKSVRKHVNAAGKLNGFTGNFLEMCKCLGFFLLLVVDLQIWAVGVNGSC